VNKERSQGVTLIELSIVPVIIGVGANCALRGFVIIAISVGVARSPISSLARSRHCHVLRRCPAFSQRRSAVGRSFSDVPFKRFGQHRRLRMRVAFPRARVVFKVARFRAKEACAAPRRCAVPAATCERAAYPRGG